jgi:adenylate kinase family enzyme
METLVKRFKTYQDQSKPVIDFYDRFGKVFKIDASRSVKEVYECTKQALIPELFCLLGPKCSGKETVGTQVAKRANMRFMNFSRFLRVKKLVKASDEKKMKELTLFLLEANATRFLIQNFP